MRDVEPFGRRAAAAGDQRVDHVVVQLHAIDRALGRPRSLDLRDHVLAGSGGAEVGAQRLIGPDRGRDVGDREAGHRLALFHVADGQIGCCGVAFRCLSEL